jgi:hypothetical protein
LDAAMPTRSNLQRSVISIVGSALLALAYGPTACDAAPAVPLVDAQSSAIGSIGMLWLADRAGTSVVFEASKSGEDPDQHYLWRLDAGTGAPTQLGDYSYDVFDDSLTGAPISTGAAGPDAPALGSTHDGRWIIGSQSKSSATAIDAQTGVQVRMHHSGSFPVGAQSFVFARRHGFGAAEAPGASPRPLATTIHGKLYTRVPGRIWNRMQSAGPAGGALGLCHGDALASDNLMAIVTDVAHPVPFHTAPERLGTCRLSADGSTLTATANTYDAAHAPAHRLTTQIIWLRHGKIRRGPKFSGRDVTRAELISVSSTGRYAVLGKDSDYTPDQRGRWLADTKTDRLRRLPEGIAPALWTSDDHTLVCFRGARLVAIDPATGKATLLADAKRRLPGTFRDRSNRGQNPPLLSTFTHDGRAVIAIVVASTSSQPHADFQFGVRVPLDGSDARPLPRTGDESFERLSYSDDGTHAFLVTSFGDHPLRALTVADADAGTWTY